MWTKCIFSLFIYFVYRYPDQQKSKEIFLEVGKKYYLEGLFVAQGGDDHIEIGVYLPDGSSLLPIASYYLSADANWKVSMMLKRLHYFNLYAGLRILPTV